MRLKVKLTPAQHTHFYDALESKEVEAHVEMGKTYATFDAEHFEDVMSEVDNHFGDLSLYEPWKLDRLENAARGAFTQRQYERCEVALVYKLHTALSDALDEKLRAHTGYNGVKGLRESCQYMTPTLRANERNRDWMLPLQSWMSFEGLDYCAS